MYGYNNKFLRVNLTNGTMTPESPSESELKAFLGGRGFIIPRLLQEVPQGTDPLSPENILIFATGPLTGYLPGSGRNSVGAKSPLTGGFGESEAGGFFGAELKRAGFDAVIIEGKSPNPVYLVIDKGTPHIKNANTIWGMGTADSEKAIHHALGSAKFRTAVIGPASENLIPFATIHNDITHVYGRNGIGAVMGSKNLKAIAVRGGKFPEVADRKALTSLARIIVPAAKKSPLRNYGTGGAIIRYNEIGNLPVNNFNGGLFANVEKISVGALRDQNLLVGMHSCFACPIRCKKEVSAQKPWPVDPVYGGPEYETLAAFGSNCGVDNIAAIAKANERCNRYGLDTITTGVVISFAMECFENGLISIEDTGGLELKFGNAEAMLETIDLIFRREGLGAILARGSLKAAEAIGNGAEKYAMQVKGLEIPMHEPRYNQSFAIHYSTHFTGADHVTGCFEHLDANNLGRYMVEGKTPNIGKVLPHELNPAKARFLHSVGLYRHLCNHLVICTLVPFTFAQFFEALMAVTGWEPTYLDFRQAVDRTMTMARIFNLREGFTAKDDRLPERFFSSPGSGPLKDISVDPKKLAEAQRAFYQYIGWSPEGMPTGKTLADLDIEWCGEFLPGE